MSGRRRGVDDLRANPKPPSPTTRGRPAGSSTVAAEIGDVERLPSTDRATPAALAGIAKGVLRLQRLAGNSAVARGLSRDPAPVQRFASTEHVALGDTASKEHTGIRYTEDPKDELSFGEVAAMAGDYFGSADEMGRLAGHPFGREQLAFARAKVNGTSPPAVSAEARKAVNDRYFNLAANNRSHFSAGGGAQANYESGHMLALLEAYKSGHQGENSYFTEALKLEAFADHYLQDLFSGGHIRTPRTQIQDYYRANFANSVELMKEFLRTYLVRRLNALNPVQLKNIPDSAIASVVNGMLDDLAGSALASFTLGSLVSLAMHDYDNQRGVPVVSGCGPDEAQVPGGFHWIAMGDNQIGSGGGAGNAATTFQMASAATKAGRVELDSAYLLGVRDAAKVAHPFGIDSVAAAATNSLAPFRALAFIPHEDTAATRPGGAPDMSDGPLGNWTWGKFSPAMRAAFEASVRAQVVVKVREAAAEVANPKKILGGWKEINARQAVVDLAGQLDRAPLTTFEALFGPAS